MGWPLAWRIVPWIALGAGGDLRPDHRRLIFQRLHDRQLAIQTELHVPGVGIPRHLLPGRVKVAQRARGQQPGTAREIPGRGHRLQKAGDANLPFPLGSRIDFGVAVIVAPAHHRPAFSADHRHVETQGVVDHLARGFEATKAIGVIVNGRSGSLVSGAHLIDHLHRPGVPCPTVVLGIVIPAKRNPHGDDLIVGQMAVLPAGVGVVLGLGQRLAELVDRVARVVQRVVQGVVVDRDPAAVFEDIAAALLNHQGDRVVARAGSHGRQGEQAATA